MDDSPPRGCFQALPLELKARIVEFARDQDKAFTARMKQATKARRESTAPFELEWYGRSVHALFEVNKELNELAAAYMFRVSRPAPDGADHWLLACRSSPLTAPSPPPSSTAFARAAANFSEEPFFTAPPSLNSNTPSRLSPSSPLVQELKLEQQAIQILLGASGDEAMEFRRTAFRDLASRITSLTVDHRKWSTVPILPYFAALTDLQLSFVNAGEGAVEMGKILRALVALEKVDLRCYPSKGSTSLAAWEADSRASRTSLRSLSISVDLLSAADVTFFAGFENLERLNMSANSLDNQVPSSPIGLPHQSKSLYILSSFEVIDCLLHSPPSPSPSILIRSPTPPHTPPSSPPSYPSTKPFEPLRTSARIRTSRTVAGPSSRFQASRSWTRFMTTTAGRATAIVAPSLRRSSLASAWTRRRRRWSMR